MEDKAKQKALEEYPKMSRITEPHGVIPADNKSHYLGDANEEKREGFIKGYHQAEKDMETASKGWLAHQLDKSYEPYGENKMMELTRFDGYAMLDAFEAGAHYQKKRDEKWLADNHKQIYNNGYEEGFEAGRDDMEDQLMKQAADAEVAVPVYEGDSMKLTQLVTTDVSLNIGEKVKLIIIK